MLTWEGSWPNSLVRRPPWLQACSVKNKTDLHLKIEFFFYVKFDLIKAKFKIAFISDMWNWQTENWFFKFCFYWWYFLSVPIRIKWWPRQQLMLPRAANPRYFIVKLSLELQEIGPEFPVHHGKKFETHFLFNVHMHVIMKASLKG